MEEDENIKGEKEEEQEEEEEEEGDEGGIYNGEKL